LHLGRGRWKLTVEGVVEHSQRGRWVASSLGLGLVGAVGAVGPHLAWGDRLPERLATHWSFSGAADGSMSATGLLVTTLLMAAAGGGLAAAYLRWGPWDRIVVATVLGLAAFLAALGAGVAIQTVLANRDATDWRTVPGPSGVALVLVVGPALVALVLVASLTARSMPIEAAPPPAVVAAMGEAPPAGARWQGSCSNPWLLGPAAAVVVVGIVVAALVSWGLGLVVAATGILVSVLARIRVTVDERGLRVAYGVARWPVTRIALDRIEQVSTLDVRPTRWGGWGYRGALSVFRQAAVVVRGGPGLRLDLRGGRVFVVTVDEPDPGATLLARFVAQARGDVRP
jgi:hypothetical protein